jgi:phosphoglucomutase
MANTSQNAKLNKLLADSEASLATAQSNTDLLKTIQEFGSYNGPLKFSFTRAWFMAVLGGAENRSVANVCSHRYQRRTQHLQSA